MIKLKFPKKIEVLSSSFKVKYNKSHDGGSFSWKDATIEIGVHSVATDPVYTLGIISHELFELIASAMGMRYMNGREENSYLFSFNHQQMENAIQIHAQTLAKFISTDSPSTPEANDN